MKNRMFKLGFFLLLILNIVLAVVIFIGKPSPLKKGDMKEQIITTLKLNETQQSQFLELAAAHLDRIIEIDKKQKQLITHYFLDQKMKEVTKQSTLEEIKELHAEKVAVTYEHFAEIETLCTPDQLPAFRDMLKELLPLISGSNPNEGPPRANIPPPH